MEQKLKLRKHTSHFAPHTSSKGITLIALVITIIVLLILAGVVINMVLGDDGIISRATDSKQQQIEKEDMEAIKLAVSGQDVLTIAEFEPAGYDKAEKIQEELAKKYGNGVRVEETTNGFKVIINEAEGRVYEIDSAKQIAKVGGTSNETTNPTNTTKPTNTTNPTSQATATTAVTATPTATTAVTQTPTPTVIPTQTPITQISITDLTAGTYVNYIDNNGNEIPCVILYDTAYNTANGTNYGIQVVSASSVQPVAIGSTDATEARNEYNGAIQRLNTTARTYLNTTYATAARCLGSLPSNPDYEGELVDTLEFARNITVSFGTVRNEDNNYVSDYTQMQNLNLNVDTAEDECWLASRTIVLMADRRFTLRTTAGEDYNIGGGYMIYDIYDPAMEDDYAGEYGTTVFECGLKPVFTLKNTLKTNGGSGTANDPYDLIN